MEDSSYPPNYPNTESNKNNVFPFVNPEQHKENVKDKIISLRKGRQPPNSEYKTTNSNNLQVIGSSSKGGRRRKTKRRKTIRKKTKRRRYRK
jgi:hypothetical protein